MATSTFISVAPIFRTPFPRLSISRNYRGTQFANTSRSCMKSTDNPPPPPSTILDMPHNDYSSTNEQKALLPTTTKAKLVDSAPPLDPTVLFGEFMCTFLFCYLSVTAAAPVTAGAPLPPPQALTNGAIIAAIVSFMPDAHLNPAVTAALLVTRRISPIRALAFVPLQLIAAGAASYLVSAVGVPVPFGGPNVSNIGKALMDEIIPMAFIVFVVFQTAVAAKEKQGELGPTAALYIGLSVLACAATFTTGVFNPARSFGPALVSGNFTAHWIYVVGPFIGAIAAALVSCAVLFMYHARTLADPCLIDRFRSICF